MKISREGLNNLISESIKKIVTESQGINWDNLTYLNNAGQISRLSPKWQVILLARKLASDDIDRTIAILKAASATLEASRAKMPPKPESTEPEQDPLDFASLVTGK